MRTETIRAEVSRLLKQTPFRPFVLNLESGDRITIEHPENIAFAPVSNDSEGSPDFYVLSGDIRFYGAFNAVSSIVLADEVD